MNNSNGGTPRRKNGLPASYYGIDPATGKLHIPRHRERYLIPEILTYEGRNSSFANVYRNPDQAVRESKENARFMRNDPAIMECLESRQRAVALLNWHIEPDDKSNPDHRQLAADMTDIISRTPHFTEYRRNLLEAIWYGRYACQNVFGLATIKGESRFVIHEWLPVSGDKLVFRFDDGTGRSEEGQIGIRTTMLPPTKKGEPVGISPRTNAARGQTPTQGRSGILPLSRTDTPTRGLTPTGSPADNYGLPHPAEMTDQGPVYFLEPWERSRLTIHKHIIEDGSYEDYLSAGRIHGVGIRDRIYWCWYQKQQTMAQLMETIERTGTGFTIYYYPAGNPHAKQEVREVAESQTKSNIILMPRLDGDPTVNAYGLERIEPNSAAISSLQQIVHDFFELQIKRYILGQTLSSEAHATGLGSGVADLHQDTFSQIVQYDAIKLEETLTAELLHPLQSYNFPGQRDVELKFKLDIGVPQSQQRLAALKTAWDMGVKIRAQNVLDAIGASAPQPGNDVLFNPSFALKQDQQDAPLAVTSDTQPPTSVSSPSRYRAQGSETWSQADELKHPRVPKGSPNGGEFVSKGQASESSDDRLNKRFHQGMKNDGSDYHSMAQEEKDAFNQGHAESVRIGHEIARHKKIIEAARKSQKQNNLSQGQRATLQKEIDQHAAQIDALNAQRDNNEKYVNKTPYKHHSTAEKLEVVAKNIAADPDKFVDAVAEAIKGKVDGITDPEQLREIAKGVAKNLLKRLVPGVGMAQSIGEAGAMAIELGGELYSFKLALDAAQTEKDLDDAADQLRHGLANVVVDKAWGAVVGKIKQKAGKAARKIRKGGDGPPAAADGKKPDKVVGKPVAEAGEQAVEKRGNAEAAVGDGAGANRKKPPANAGANGAQAGAPPVKPPMIGGIGKRKKEEAPKGKYRGGRHGEMKGPKGDGLESHHMPAKSVNGLSEDHGPAIQMEPEDHKQTASHSNQPGNAKYRAKSEKLIKQGKFGEAIQRDINDIRKKFGNKYDEAIKEMIEGLDPSMKKGLKG